MDRQWNVLSVWATDKCIMCFLFSVFWSMWKGTSVGWGGDFCSVVGCTLFLRLVLKQPGKGRDAHGLVPWCWPSAPHLWWRVLSEMHLWAGDTLQFCLEVCFAGTCLASFPTFWVKSGSVCCNGLRNGEAAEQTRLFTSESPLRRERWGGGGPQHRGLLCPPALHLRHG